MDIVRILLGIMYLLFVIGNIYEYRKSKEPVNINAACGWFCALVLISFL